MNNEDKRIKGYIICESPSIFTQPTIEQNSSCGRVIIKTTLQDADVRNRNKRIYPKAVIQKGLEKMGYRFAVRYVEYAESGSKGDTLEFNMYVENRGNSPIYINHPLTFKLKNEKYEKVYTTDIDIRKWLPGDTIQSFTLTLPEDIEAGDYELYIGLVGEFPRPTIKFAFETKEENGYYKLVDISVK